ncbi:aminomethyl-transferring glycine dehydrogenase subunit GcvPA [Acholeplasma granularum]|uniref:aminomethyl-transferring glycine dehydrogenase subunit GcvPA n=1 Tax=Acholeplasma granularum TaxID=264635 RepID=UPI0004AD6975|nr:aminomethyl-transferring glycine dehydrogenase subunit GcvPA [Acholeplasma granularum]
MHKYLPHTKVDIEHMLKKIGIQHIDDLTMYIPNDLKYNKPYGIPNQLSDLELTKELLNLSNLNKQLTIFRGYGAYDVYTPSIVKSLTSRQEFLTSYTPYQPEVSQGTLQYIFEFQSLICEITGMDITNASMYDGPSATAEAMFMAVAETKRKKIIYSETINPRTIDIIKTYGKYRDLEFVLLPELNGVSDLSKLADLLKDSAGVIFQNPNHYGNIENLDGISNLIHEHGALFITNQDPQSLALLKTPGELGVDIATGDLQSFGIPLSYGGAYAGYLATTNKLIRKMPGRICGVTTDLDGKRAFVLTLQAREQHIKRAKANSNICSNQSLMALSVAIYLSSLGKNGFKDVAKLSLNGAYYLESKLLETNLFNKVFDQPHYKEFTLKFNGDVNKFDEYLISKGYLGPIHLGDNLLTFAVTEKRTKKEINEFVKVIGEFK